MVELNAKVLAVIAQVAAIKGNRFASLTYTAKESGEQARHTILIGFDYNTAVQKSLEMLQAKKFRVPLLRQAQAELIASFEKTLEAHAKGEQNEDYTKADAYETVAYNGEPVNGIRFNKNDGSFKLFGLVQYKVILKNGVFKAVNSKPLTIAKKNLRRLLPVGKFREYAIEPNALETAKLNGNTIEL